MNAVALYALGPVVADHALGPVVAGHALGPVVVVGHQPLASFGSLFQTLSGASLLAWVLQAPPVDWLLGALGASLPGAMPPLSLSDTIEDGFYSIATMLVGLAIVGYSYSRHRQRRLMQDTATSEIGSMAVGAVELTGTVERAEETVPALLTDEECVIVDYTVEEYRWGDDGKEWVTQEVGTLTEPFYLNDGTGRVLVDVSGWSTGYEISEANRTREEYDDTATQPATVAPFLDAYGDESADSDEKRRYTQEVLPVGAEAYVFGDAELASRVECPVEPDPDASGLIVTEDLDTEMFLISDKTEDELTDDRRFSLVLGGLGGIAVFSVGLAWFLSVVGV